MLPCLGQNICKINRTTGEPYIEENPVDLKYKEIGWSKYSGYCEDNEFIWCANRVSNYFLFIDKKNEQVNWAKMLQPAERDLAPYLSLRKGIFNESELDLKDFLANLDYI